MHERNAPEVNSHRSSADAPTPSSLRHDHRSRFRLPLRSCRKTGLLRLVARQLLPRRKDKWVQNFFIHMNTAPRRLLLHLEPLGRGRQSSASTRTATSSATRTCTPTVSSARTRPADPGRSRSNTSIPKNNEFDFIPEGITCDGEPVKFPDLYQPTALAVANDGSLMVADSLHRAAAAGPVLRRSRPGAAQARPGLRRPGRHRLRHAGQVTPTKFWGIRGIGDGQRRQHLRRHERDGHRPPQVHAGGQARLGALRPLLRRRRLRRPRHRRPRRVGHPGTLPDGLLPAPPARTPPGSATRSTGTSIPTTRAA